MSTLVISALGLLLSACNGGITPDDLLWRRSSQARGRGVVYPLTVRHDSIILGGPPYSRFLLLDERTGAARDTLDTLANPNREILLGNRLPIAYNGRESRMIIPVDSSFIVDSLILVSRTPLLRGGPFTKLLSMRRRSDGEWRTLEFDLHEMHPNDIAPYRDRFLVVQYTTDHRSRQGYRYEVGLLDLGREPGIQELGVRTIHQRASPLSLLPLRSPPLYSGEVDERSESGGGCASAVTPTFL